MNILFYTAVSPFSDKRFGGAESSIQLLAQHLKLKGHKIIWFTQSDPVFCFPYVKKNNVHGIFIRFFKPTKGSGKLKLIKEFNQLVLKSYIIKFIRQYKIDIVYCFYDLNFLNYILGLKQNGIKFRVVMRMAGMYWYEQCLKTPSRIKNYETVFNSIDCVNFIHSGLEHMVFDKLKELDMNVKFRNTLIGDIGSSVNIGRKKRYQTLNNPFFTMIMATRFSSVQKRQDILVKALSLIDRNIPIKLTLIGSGPERDRIVKMISELNLEDRVRIEPFTKQNILWDKLESADMLCHACDYEGLGKIIIESMAIGLPVLVSNVAPLNEYIKDGENGFLVDNTPSDWAKKIESLYHKKEDRAKVSEKEMKFIKDHYDPQKNVNLYENCFSRLISAQ